MLSEAATFSFEYAATADYREAVRRVRHNCHDVYLCGAHLGSHTGLELLSVMRQPDVGAPVIILSEATDNQSLQHAIRAGASDCLAKDRLTGEMLQRSVRYATERHHLLRQLHVTARQDPHTGLANAPMFRDFLRGAIARSDRGQRALGLLVMKANELAGVRERLGAGGAEIFLRVIAERVLNVVRAGDLVARIDDDRFAIVVDDIRGEANARIVAENIFDALHASVRVEDTQVSVSASIGIAIYPNGKANAADLLNAANSAVDEASLTGGNECQFFVGRVENKTSSATSHHPLDVEDASNLRSSGWA